MARDVHTSPVRGMRDLLPEECELRDWAVGVILDTYRRFGFQRVETPALEHLKLLTGGDGGENEKLIFKVLKRGDELGAALAAVASAAASASATSAATADAAQGTGPGTSPERPENRLADSGLRFDLTVPLARFYAEHDAELPSPFKSIQIGPVWRAERPQKGRFRQFTQCDIDILGEAGESAEIELILATTEALSELGLSGLTVRVNDRRVLAAALRWSGMPEERFTEAMILLDKDDKLDPVEFDNQLFALNRSRDCFDRLKLLGELKSKVLSTVDELPDAGTFELLRSRMEQEAPELFDAGGVTGAGHLHGAFESLMSIAATCRSVASARGRFVFDPTLVRGMGYYTGPIFEIGVEGLPYSIAGGGRYDHMLGKLLGREVPACGFSIGFERVIAWLLDRGVSVPRAGKLLALLHDAPGEPGVASLAEAVVAAAKLRAQGHAVSLQVKRKKAGKQLDDLQKQGFDGAATLSAGGGEPQVKWFADRATSDRAS